MAMAENLRGLRRAIGQPKLPLLLWAANLLLAVLAGLPMASRLFEALPPAPDGDLGLDGFSVGLMHDVLSGQLGLSGAFGSALLAVVVLALVLNAWLAGGVLECLHDTPGGFGERFGRGAGRRFGQFLWLGLVGGASAFAAAAVVAVPFQVLAKKLESSAWEPAQLLTRAGGLLLAGAIFVLGLVALDLARIEIVRSATRKVLRVFFRRFWSVFRHPLQPLALWLVNALLLALGIAVYLLFRSSVPIAGWVGLLATIVAQQAIVAARAVLRVTLWSAEMELADRRWPPVLDAVAAPAASAIESREPTADDEVEEPVAAPEGSCTMKGEEGLQTTAAAGEVAEGTEVTNSDDSSRFGPDGVPEEGRQA